MKLFKFLQSKIINSGTIHDKEMELSVPSELNIFDTSVGDNFLVNGKLLTYGNGRLQIGDNVTINSGEKYNYVDGTSTRICILNGCLEIGSNVGISNSSITARKSVIIEDHVAIGAGCIIADTDFHSLYLENRINGDIEVNSERVIIRKGAFIGARSIVLKGVEIGEEAVVGAGSVVTHDIPTKEVWGGNPARFIRKL